MRNYIFYILAILAFACSCSSDQKTGKKKVTAKAQSAPYELLIVADKDWVKSQAGQAFVETVAGPIEGLPQIEKSFDVTNINPVNFKGTFHTYSNIICVEFSKKYQDVTADMVNDVYCTPQAIITIKAPDNDALNAFLSTESMNSIVTYINNVEIKREKALLEKHYSNVVNKKSQELFGFGIKAPQDIDEVKAGKNFMWGSASKQEFRENVCIYTLPLKDLTVEEIIAARDSVMKINIPGDREDQWMETDRRTITAKNANIDGKEVLEVRGLWDMRNDAMGGPFVAYIQPDYDNNRVVVTEGFVFAPEEKKRPIIRKLEAMLQTMILK